MTSEIYWDFLVQKYVSGKIFVKIRSFFPRGMNRIVEKCTMLNNSLKNFELQMTSGNFHEDAFSSFCMKLLTERQKNSQTPGIK